MKKLFAVLLASAISLTAVVGATACSISDLQNLVNQEDEDGDDNDDTTGGGTGGGEEQTAMEIAQGKIKELGQKSGYEITMTITESGEEPSTITSGVKENTFWTYYAYNGREQEGKASVKQDEHTATLYDYENGEWSVNTTMVMENVDTVCEVTGMTFGVYLFMESPCHDPEYKTGTETVAGRSCDKYYYSSSAFGVSATYSASYDKETGCLLKWHYSYQVSGETASTTMEVTSFKTGGQVTVPVLPDAGEDYTDYTGVIGWPTNSYTALVGTAPGTVSSSMIMNERFFATTKGVSEEEFNNFVNALTQKGFVGEAENGVFNGLDEQGNSVELYYFASSGDLSITVEKAVD